MKTTAFYILLVLAFTGVKNLYGQSNQEKNFASLRANLAFLASDELNGRYTGSVDEKVASRFIVTKLEEYGIKPLLPESGYFQDVPLASRIVDSASFLELTLNDQSGQTEKLVLSEDFSLWGGFLPQDIPNGKVHQIEFVGYGITAAEFGYDDYAGRDVKGKVIVFISGEPASEDPSYFDGPAPSKYSNDLSKFFNATSKGVAGIVWIIPDRFVPFLNRMNVQSFEEAITFPDSAMIRPESPLPPIIYLYPDGWSKLMRAENFSPEEIKKKAENGEVLDGFSLVKNMTFHIERTMTPITGRNVLGVLDGQDPLLKNEYLVISAHYDHMGTRNGRILNGADDNSSGVVALLEIIRELAAGPGTKRSVIAAFYTGEEKGLLGSSYFVRTFGGIGKVVANLNIDMCGRESIDTLFCVGPDISSPDLLALITEVNEKGERYILDYSNSNYEWLARSDLAPYYNFKIPVADFGDNMKQDYHRPTDDADKIDFNKIYKTATLVKSVALEVANQQERIRFKGAF